MASFTELLRGLGVTAHWSLGDAANGTAVDDLGGHDGTYAGTGAEVAPALAAGLTDGAYRTNGTSWVVVPDPDQVFWPNSGTYTIGMYIRVDALPAAGTWANLFSKNNNGPNVVLTATGGLQLSWYDGVALKIVETPPTWEGGYTVPLGTPVFLGFEVDHATGLASIYVDGVQIVQAEATIEPGIYSEGDLVIGASNAAGDSPFTGVIDGAFVKVNGTFRQEDWAALFESMHYPPGVEWVPFEQHHVLYLIDTAADFTHPELDAERYQAIVVQTWQTAYRDAVKAANPDCIVLGYQNFGHITEGSTEVESSGAVSEEVALESYFGHDSNGNRVRNPAFPFIFYANVGDAGFRAAVVDGVLAHCAGFDGVFLDDVNTQPSSLNPGDLVEFPTDEDYRLAVGDALAVIYPQLSAAGLKVCANFGAWHAHPDEQEDWLQNVDYALNEQGLRYTGSVEVAYYAHADNTVRAAITAERYGVGAWVSMPLRPDEYDLAAYGQAVMLVASNGRVALQAPGIVGSSATYSWGAWDERAFDTDWLGAPLEPAEQLGEKGIWRRRFENGVIYLNTQDTDKVAEADEGLVEVGELQIPSKRALYVARGVHIPPDPGPVEIVWPSPPVEPPDPPVWEFVITDHQGSPVADVTQATGRKLTFVRNGAAEVTFTLAHDTEAASALAAAFLNGLPRLKCYQDGELRFYGHWAPQKDAAGPDESVASLTFRSPFARYEFAFLDGGDIYAGMDAGQIAWDLLDSKGPLGYAQGTIEATVFRDRNYEDAQPVGEAVLSLTSVIDGFDFSETFRDDLGSDVLAEFNVHASLGSDRSGALIFEYGDGTTGNVASVSREVQYPVNYVKVIGEEGKFGVAQDAASITKYGRFEKVVHASDGTVEQATLDARAAELLRPEPVRVVEFQPDPVLAPQPWLDYWLGDTVTCRARDGSFVIDEGVRVNGIEIALDDEGNEAAHTLVFEQEGGS